MCQLNDFLPAAPGKLFDLLQSIKWARGLKSCLEKLLTSFDARAGLRFLGILTADLCSCTSNTTTELRHKA